MEGVNSDFLENVPKPEGYHRKKKCEICEGTGMTPEIAFAPSGEPILSFGPACPFCTTGRAVKIDAPIPRFFEEWKNAGGSESYAGYVSYWKFNELTRKYHYEKKLFAIGNKLDKKESKPKPA